MLKQSIKTIQFVKKYKKYKASKGIIEQEKAAQYVADFIKQEGGLFLKMAQYLGTNSEQSKVIQELSSIKNNGIELKDIKIILEEELGQNWSSVFKSIDETAFTASIGQVHKAKLTSGETVAVKVQYPLIEQTLKEQMKLLKLIPSGKAEKKWGVDIGEYQRMVKTLIEEELDYSKEMSKQNEVHRRFKNSSYIKVPKVFEEFSNKKILVTEFLEGYTIGEIESWSVKDKRKLSEIIVFSYLELLKNGFLQADTNHGNFIFLKDSDEFKLGLIDYGQFCTFEASFTKSLLSLIYNVTVDNTVDYFSYMVELGFDGKKLKNIQNSLPLLAKVIFEPFTANKNYNLSTWNYKNKIDLILGEDKWWFRSAGGEDFFLLLKSFMGFKNLIIKLNGRVNWQQVFFESVKDIKEDLLNYSPEKSVESETNFDGASTKLLINVLEDGKRIINLTLPIKAIFELNDIIDKDILKLLEKRNININDIITKAVRNGAFAQELFYLKNLNKEYTVSIE
jgi:predicted unusual protein kinase regulating ubiquinone biosynthesis (AarF/ABC1/UbiB family)